MALKILIALHFYHFEEDKLFQAVAAKNLAEGRGLTVQTVYAEDLAEKVTISLNRWSQRG